jgi:hypothetical protein
VKGGLLRLHPLYQLLDPINRSLIGDPGGQGLVMLDLAVEFGTLFTHRNRSNRATFIGRLIVRRSKAKIVHSTRTVQTEAPRRDPTSRDFSSAKV